MKIIQALSPNSSPSTLQKRGVQIHKTLGTDSLGWLRNPESNASANYLIKRDGTIYELVNKNKRAWTAGKIVKPNERGRAFMIKDDKGKWIKPGYYAYEIEYECLFSQTFTEKQYQVSIELYKTFGFEINKNNLLTHTDTCWYKPDLTKERIELLRRMGIKTDAERIKILQNVIIMLVTKVAELYDKLRLLNKG